VEPSQFAGRLLHQLPPAQCLNGELYLEIYLAEPDQNNCIGLYRNGTRVLESLTRLDEFARPPWNAGYLQGIIDAPFLNLINKGHRDFVFAARSKALQTRYICRLFIKELIAKNFAGFSSDQLLERMVELSLYTEENLKA